MSKVLLLAKLTPQSGNQTTAERIRDLLLENGYSCELQSTTSFENPKAFREYLVEGKVQCVIGIHLWRAGDLLLDSNIPFSLIFGGTDLNVHYKESDKLRVMTKVVKQAKNLVAFSHAMACKAKELWPDIESKIILQAQGVSTKASTFSEKDMINQLIKFGSPKDKSYLENVSEGSLILFLLVAGLRPVKDPMFLFKSISEWHEKDPRVYFVVVGGEMDLEFSKAVKQSAKQCLGVLVIPTMAQCDLHAVIKYCTTAVVNSSSNEGMASSILEAMDLETPVIARRNSGNESLIRHNENGLLFDNQEEFISLAQELVSSDRQRERLTSAAKQYISDNHSMTAEKETYRSIVEKLIKN